MAVIFRHLVRGGSFPASGRLADVVPVAKGSGSSDNDDYRLICIMPVLSQVFEKNVAGQLTHFLEGNSVLPSSQFSYRRE